jgi:hypothetical protein
MTLLTWKILLTEVNSFIFYKILMNLQSLLYEYYLIYPKNALESGVETQCFSANNTNL